MIDVQFIRDNPDVVREKSRQKGYEVDVDRLLELDGQRRTRQTQADELRRRRNDQAAGLKGQRPSEEEVAAGKQLKEELAQIETELKTIEEQYGSLLSQVPNMPLDDVPVGASEDDNVVAKQIGERPELGFAPRSHYALAEPKGLIDKERAARISGSRFAYIKGDLVRLQFAVIQLVFDTLADEAVLKRLIAENGLDISARPFVPVLPPAMLRTEPYQASARLNAEEVTYKLDGDDAWLNASAEHTMCTMYWNEVLPEAELPVRYIGYSTSFRREAGTYGKDTEGIIRMHQFDKLEMEVFSTPETGLAEHKLLIAVQEHLVKLLGLPYQLLQKCTADIGKPNARGVDIEVWLPGEGKYRETHTADYMTDYQARRLKTRCKRSDGSIDYVHTNDATAFALGRIMAAIMENYQTADGDVRVPEVLKPYMGGKEVI